jgi:glycosyltransferase involved in cell wall biosynthesis/capsular polysaccharide biosynthesis protein
LILQQYLNLQQLNISPKLAKSVNTSIYNPSSKEIELAPRSNSANLVPLDTPLVSVIIPVYNSAQYIQKAIASVLSQTYGNYEIIVVDDGSTDETRSKLELYQPKIRYIFQENQGSAAARNTGIKLAQGELIAFLDSDDYWSMPEKLAKQVTCFEQNPDLGGINTGWKIVDGDSKHVKTVQPWHKAPKLDLETWLKKKCVRTSAMMFRKEWLEKVGGFDPELRQSHDVDLILRLSLAGCETDWLKEETVCYRQHDSNTTKDSLKQARYIQAVLDKFFARNDVPDDIGKQEGQIRYHTLVWIAWYQYNAGNLDEMAKFLQQSLDFSPYLRAENIAHWLDNFKRFTEERGCQSNIDSLTNSLQWQRLIAFTLELDQNKFQHLQEESPQNEKRLNELLNQVEELLAEKEKLDQEIASYRRTLEIQPNSPEFKQKSLATSKSKPSQQKYKFNVRLNASVEDYRKLAEALQKKGEFAEIADLYRLAVQRNPDNYRLYKNLGEILVKQKQIDEAVLAYQKSVELNPQFAWSYKGLGEALELKGRRSEAITSYQKAIKLDAGTIIHLHTRLEKLLNIEDREGEVLSLYQYALKKIPDERKFQVRLYEKLSDFFIQQKDWKQANINLIKALQIKPDYVPAYEKIADIWEQQGKPILPSAEATSPSTFCELPQDFLHQYCNLTGDWLIDSKSDSRINHIPVYSSSQIVLPSTKTIESKEIPSCMQTQNIKVAEAFVAIVPEGRAWGDTITSAVITPDNKLVSQTYSGVAELIVSSDQLPAAQYIDGTVAFLSVRWGGTGYFHWIFDVLTRLELLCLSGINFESIDKFIINKYSQRFQIETLAHLGIPPEKIIENSKVQHIQAKNLIVPSLPKLRAYRDAQWACNAIKKRFVNTHDVQTCAKPERIYINRKNAPHRHVVNEDAVISFLADWGFTSIALESMLFSEQVLCMASAKVVVAVHGAGLSNLVFCDRGTKVIEIFSPAHVQNTYWRIGNVCELDHYHLMSDDTHPDVDLSERSVKRDVCVNLDDLAKLLEIAEVEKLRATHNY